VHEHRAAADLGRRDLQVRGVVADPLTGQPRELIRARLVVADGDGGQPSTVRIRKYPCMPGTPDIMASTSPLRASSVSASSLLPIALSSRA
jgi:hypothetical protein